MICRDEVEALVKTYHDTTKPGAPAFPAQSYAFSVLGSQLLEAKKIKEAIEIFKLNLEAYPDSANKYDKMANAYAADGNTNSPLSFTKKSWQLTLNTQMRPLRLSLSRSLDSRASSKMQLRMAKVEITGSDLPFDGLPPTDETECTFLTLDAFTPYVKDYPGSDAGKMAHYLVRRRMRDGSLSAWGETVNATITG